MMVDNNRDMESSPLSEHDEIAALLPWYVSGKISQEDRAKVDAYMARHPSQRSQIALAREEADLIFAENISIAPPRAALDTLRASIAAQPGLRFNSVKSSLLERMGTMLAGLGPRQLAYATLSAAFAIAVLSGLAGSLLTGRPADYTVASGPSASGAKGTFALVTIEPAVPVATLSAFLAENKMTIVEGPKAGGIYRLRLSEERMEAAAAESALARIKARRDLFAFVSKAPDGP